MATNVFNYYEIVLTTIEEPNQRKFRVGASDANDALSIINDYVTNTLVETGLVICSLVDSKTDVIVNDETP